MYVCAYMCAQSLRLSPDTVCVPQIDTVCVPQIEVTVLALVAAVFPVMLSYQPSQTDFTISLIFFIVIKDIS